MPPLLLFGLEACTSKCFWNDSSREKTLCKWDLCILGDPSPVFPLNFISPPPSLLCIEAFEDHRCMKEPFFLITFRLCKFVDWAIHTCENSNNRRLVFCNLTKCCNFSAHVSTCYTPPCSSHLVETNPKTGNNREWRYIISHYHLLFLHLLFRACLIVSTETANCCFLFDLPANAEVLSGPIWSCSPPLFLLFS